MTNWIAIIKKELPKGYTVFGNNRHYGIKNSSSDPNRSIHFSVNTVRNAPRADKLQFIREEVKECIQYLNLPDDRDVEIIEKRVF